MFRLSVTTCLAICLFSSNLLADGVVLTDTQNNSVKKENVLINTTADLEAITKFAGRSFDTTEFGLNQSVDNENPLSLYETFLPYGSKEKISRLESKLLIRYLENPASMKATKTMAAYHLLDLHYKSQLKSKSSKKSNIQRLKTLIYAQYFLLRSKQIGSNAKWVSRSIDNIDRALEDMLPSTNALDLTEGNSAHKAFLEAFVSTEENRYKAENAVIGDLFANPTNLTTNLYSSAVNLWNAGEVDYDDPTAIYSYLKASYFGRRATALIQQAEKEALLFPGTHKPYRLAPAVAAFTLQPRRWLAKFHNDPEAVRLIDAELSEWLPKYPSFYAFPIAVLQFSEPENAANGFYALAASLDSCQQNRDVFCKDHPRASYNVVSFILFASEYFLKIGDIGTASAMLTFRYSPDFKYDTWNLGRDAQEHRERNITQIGQLYHNSDPSDDPANLFIKKRKWGPESSTCQLCHQEQGISYTEEELNTVESLDEADLYVGEWPTVTTTWYGAIKNIE